MPWTSPSVTAEPLDYHAGQTMIELGILRDKIGANDPHNSFKHAVVSTRRKQRAAASLRMAGSLSTPAC